MTDLICYDVDVEGKVVMVSAVCYGEELTEEEVLADARHLAGAGPQANARIVSKCPNGEHSNVIPFGRKRP